MTKRSLVSLLLCLTMLFSTCGTVALADDAPTYTAAFVNDYIVGDPNEVMPFIKKTVELTGINIEWTSISSTDLQTQRSLMIASGDIPDISFFMFDNASVLEYGPMGLFLPLEDYIDTCMPNFKNYAETYEPWLLNSLTLSDGHIYTLPKIGAPNVPTTVMVEINQVWLDKLGLAMPTTTDELFDVLVAFKEQDPNGNGVADEIPLAMPTEAWQLGQMEAWFWRDPRLAHP